MSRTVNLGQIVPNIQIGETQTVDPGTNAYVENIGTSLNPILKFYIPKGNPGVIQVIVVNELPPSGEENTLYFVPKQDTKEEDLYDEYYWVNNDWERIGEKQIVVDLTDYVKNTDYATTSVGGVIKTSNARKFSLDAVGLPLSPEVSYNDYGNLVNTAFIGKGTLENVIAGKDLTTKAYVDGLVGDIGTALDEIQGEVI